MRTCRKEPYGKQHTTAAREQREGNETAIFLSNGFFDLPSIKKLVTVPTTPIPGTARFLIWVSQRRQRCLLHFVLCDFSYVAPD